MKTVRTDGPLLLSDMAAAAGLIAAGRPVLGVAQVQFVSTGIDSPVTSAAISTPDRSGAANLAEALLLRECSSPEGEHYWAGAPSSALEAAGQRTDLGAAGLWVEVVDEVLPSPVLPTITLQEVSDLLDLVTAAALTPIPTQAIHVRAAAGEVEIHTIHEPAARRLAGELVGLDLHLRAVVRSLTP